METKHILAAACLLFAGFGGVTAACLSQRVRDAFFFLLVTTAALTEKFDVNFVSREWYRGTTMGFEISFVDVLAVSLLVSTILVPRPGERRFYWPSSFGLMLLFFAFAVLCVGMADPKLFGMFSLLKMLRGLVVFAAVALYVRSERELKIFLVALALIVGYEAFKGIEQRYRFGIHRVFGDLNAANSLSMYFCLTAPVFIAAINSRLPNWMKWLSAAAVMAAGIGMVLTISRTGIVTLGMVLLGAVVCTMTWKFTAKKVLISVLVAVGVAGVLAKSWESLSSRFGETTLEEEYESKRTQGRWYYIRMAGAILQENWFGVGPNNWSFWVSNKYGPRMGFKFAPYPSEHRMPKFEVEAGANVDDPQAAPAHNLGALTAGEMGVGGLLLMMLLWLRWFGMGAGFLWRRTPEPMRRIGVGIFFGTVGIFLQSLTEWVWHQTAIFFTFNILMGVLASLCHVKRRERREALRREQDERDPDADAQAEDGEFPEDDPLEPEVLESEDPRYARGASA